MLNFVAGQAVGGGIGAPGAVLGGGGGDVIGMFSGPELGTLDLMY